MFTCIDRVVADHAQFIRWIEQESSARKAAAIAHERMLADATFPMFCEEVGIVRSEWGKPDADLSAEVSLFHEWVEMKRTSAPPAFAASASNPDLAETQILEATW